MNIWKRIAIWLFLSCLSCIEIILAINETKEFLFKDFKDLVFYSWITGMVIILIIFIRNILYRDEATVL
jgi:hypothetical protein